MACIAPIASTTQRDGTCMVRKTRRDADILKANATVDYREIVRVHGLHQEDLRGMYMRTRFTAYGALENLTWLGSLLDDMQYYSKSCCVPT